MLYTRGMGSSIQWVDEGYSEDGQLYTAGGRGLLYSEDGLLLFSDFSVDEVFEHLSGGLLGTLFTALCFCSFGWLVIYDPYTIDILH